MYYDAHSQYYYNNETGAYLYWDSEKSTYMLASTSNMTSSNNSNSGRNNQSNSLTDISSTSQSSSSVVAPPPPNISSSSTISAPANINEEKKDATKKENKQDKVKVAKKIVKDMEKWAKQLNQKKEMSNMAVATPQPLLSSKIEENNSGFKSFGNIGGGCSSSSSGTTSGYADVGFSILEKKEKGKFDIGNQSSSINKLVSSYGSDSDDHDDNHTQYSGSGSQESNEKDYVDFERLTCLLCKRAFQSHDILNKHLKMSNLHKENLQKYNLTRGFIDGGNTGSFQG